MVRSEEVVPLGRSGVRVTRVGLGTAPLGCGVTSAASQELFKYVLGTSSMLVDTAPFYGFGLSERRVGEGLRLKASRPTITLATKVGRLVRNGDVVQDYSYDGTLRSIEESMQRLGSCPIDIVHVHDPDDHFDEACKGAFRALRDLKAEGVIRAIGAGMNQWEMLSRFVDLGLVDCVLLAGRYSLLDRTAEETFLPQAQSAGVGVIIGGVFNGGLLADPARNPTFNYAPAPPNILNRAMKMQSICARHGVTLKAAAAQFPLRNSAVSSIVLGVQSADEWHDSQSALHRHIPEEVWVELAPISLR